MRPCGFVGTVAIIAFSYLVMVSVVDIRSGVDQTTDNMPLWLLPIPVWRIMRYLAPRFGGIVSILTTLC